MEKIPTKVVARYKKHGVNYYTFKYTYTTTNNLFVSTHIYKNTKTNRLIALHHLDVVMEYFD